MNGHLDDFLKSILVSCDSGGSIASARTGWVPKQTQYKEEGKGTKWISTQVKLLYGVERSDGRMGRVGK